MNDKRYELGKKSRSLVEIPKAILGTGVSIHLLGQVSYCLGRGGGLVVSVLTFYSNDPSSIPAEVYNFSVKLLLKITKINIKRPGLANLKKSLILL